MAILNCNNQKVVFNKKNNGDHKAVDVFCGQEYKGHVWYCSIECKESDGVKDTNYTNKFNNRHFLGGWGA